MEVLHVVGSFYVFDYVSASRCAECFDGKDFVIFHFGLVGGFDDGDGFPGVDLVGSDGVAV